MKKIKHLLFIFLFLGSLSFLFSPEVFPENFQFQELLNSTSQAEVIIIFNSGGWGNTPLEEAKDFAPIIEGIEKTLKDFGYNSLVIPYTRTKDDMLGEIAGARDFLNSFKSSSEILAEKVNFLTKSFPDKKIILAGLSAGGAFVDETMEKIADEAEDSVYPVRQNFSNEVYAISAGSPFWVNTPESDNILQLDNNGRDSLAEGKAKPLFSALIKAPFKWIFSKFKGQNLTFAQAIQVPGHEYSWSSPEVGPQIITFLENKLRNYAK